MDVVNNFILWLDSGLGSAFWFPYFLLGTGLFFTLYLKFPQIRYFRQAWRILLGRYSKKGAPGDTTHFQALSTALSGTVGTGNIGGVGLALFLGGPAALFWMWATAFMGMTTKFVEVTLSHKYRIKTADGTMAGGPMYYMERRLKMRWLAIPFAIATVLSSFGTGSLPQINSIAVGLKEGFGFEPIMTGAVLSVILGFVIIGGISRIAKITSKLVPFMALVYVIGALAVIFANIENVLSSFLSIFTHVFSGTAAVGGFLGATFAYAFNRGVARGLFSNEAGQGSAPIAHASAKTNEPVAEGMVAILEPFIDTIIICTLTGLVILSSGVWTEKFENQFQTADMEYIAGNYSDQIPEQAQALFAHVVHLDSDPITRFTGKIEVVNGTALEGSYTLLNSRSVAEDVRYQTQSGDYNGMLSITAGKLDDSTVVVSGKSLLHSLALTSKAFTKGFFGEFGKYIIAIGILLFAFSTAIAWSYYGDRAIIYLVGPKGILPYRIVYISAFFVASFADTTLIWNLSLVTIAVMTLPNLVGILLLRSEIKQEVDGYWQRFNAK